MVNENWHDLIYKFSDKLSKNDEKVFIHVVGDSMLDIDYQVKVSRISPECPNVNILLSEDDIPFKRYPGGAANVCYQLNNFNIVSRLFTFIDLEAYCVIRNYGINYWGASFLPENYYVPRKKRFYEKGFQVVARMDVEKAKYGLDDSNLRYFQAELCKGWLAFQAEPDVIIFSDYNKGLFLGDFKLNWFNTKAITIVDPKMAPLERWVGCNVFKPNSKEAEVLSGLKDWQRQCDFFRKELRCKSVVITQEGDGIVGYDDDYFEYRPNFTVKPLDIIGAGDCFIGILALALVHGFSVTEAAQIAFHGGAMYVQQKQRGMLGPWSFHSSGKILKNWEFLKNRGYKLTFTNGCFDIITPSHIRLLEFAKSKGDKLLVAVNSDESIKRLKGQDRPILTLKDRMKILSGFECVDFLISFDNDTPLNLVEDICPDFIVKGGDYTKEAIAGSSIVGLDNVILYPFEDGCSTTAIIEKIKDIC